MATKTEPSLKISYKSKIERIKLWECEPWRDGEYHNPRTETLDSKTIVTELKATKLWSPAVIDGNPQLPIVHPLADGKHEVLRGHRRRDALAKLVTELQGGNNDLIAVKDEKGIQILAHGVECIVIQGGLTTAEKLAIIADPSDTRKLDLSVREKFSLFKQMKDAGYSTKAAYSACGYGSLGNPMFTDLLKLGPSVVQAWQDSYKEGRKIISQGDIRSLAKLVSDHEAKNPGKVDKPAEFTAKLTELVNAKPEDRPRPVSMNDLYDQIIKPLAEGKGPDDLISLLALVTGRKYDAKNRVFTILPPDEKANKALAELIAWRKSILEPAKPEPAAK